MKTPELIALIAAGVTLTGIILTGIHNLFHERLDRKKHERQMALEDRKAQLDERRSALELYNQREIRIFEARLSVYLHLYEVLMKFRTDTIRELRPEKAGEIRDEFIECVYGKTCHCMSTDSLLAGMALEDALLQFSKGEIEVEQLKEKRLTLLRALNRDLGRTGEYLGDYEALIDHDLKTQERILRMAGLAESG